jgi:hypothetical protein
MGENNYLTPLIKTSYLIINFSGTKPCRHDDCGTMGSIYLEKKISLVLSTA